MPVLRSLLPISFAPSEFGPLMPTGRLGALIDTTRRVFEKSSKLKASASPETRDALRAIVRSMNSYYSNAIEGESTHPANIERALHQDFSSSPDVARRQRLALAHIDAERELEGQMTSEAQALCSNFLRRAHASLYGRLSVADRTVDDGRIVLPGALRTHDLSVGRHCAPAWASVPAFLQRMDEVYGGLRGVDALLYTIASAHHRMAWTHPFEDGNGRAVRLQTHGALLPMSGGLWSVTRGLARDRASYYEMLGQADSARRGSFDGTGELRQETLRAWCEYFALLCEDQVDFMAGMLDFPKLKDRIRAYVAFRKASDGIAEYRPEAVLPLQTVATAGALPRGDFIRMTGLEERTARKLVARFLQDGLLQSDGHRSELRIAFPLASLNILFPNLYPEAGTKHFE